MPLSIDPAAHWPLYAGAVAVVVVLMLVQRIPIVRGIVSVLVWGAGLALILVLLGQRAQFDPFLGQFAQALNLGGESVAGGETRIRMSPDGHFWLTARINGVERRMLIDSGATITALSPGTAEAAGLRTETGLVPVMLQTANGTVQADTATVPEIRMGNIVARDLPVVVSPGFGEMNVIGMNFLSRLKSWRVEGRTLILVPHHPQAGGRPG